MSHREYIRIVPGAKTAVLFLHGICGSPNHFRQLLPMEQAIPSEWSVYNIVLDGHCKSVEDFGRTSMKIWKAQVQSVFDELCQTHDKIVLTGHSMGTLFSIDLAVRYPEKVAFAFLLAVPVKVFVKPRAIGYLMRIAFNRIDESNPVLVSMRDACGISQTKKIWKYIPWAMRMVELLQLCRKTGKMVPRIGLPTIAWQSVKDEMVSSKADVLLKKSGRVDVHTLPNSTHFYYPPEEVEMIMQSFRESCEAYI